MCPALYSLEIAVCMLGRGWFAVPEVRCTGEGGVYSYVVPCPKINNSFYGFSWGIFTKFPGVS